jgi:hypothetical protein
MGEHLGQRKIPIRKIMFLFYFIRDIAVPLKDIDWMDDKR